ncbi:hypothetical protein L914_11530, partial [Phytophthora nicotianae]
LIPSIKNPIHRAFNHYLFDHASWTQEEGCSKEEVCRQALSKVFASCYSIKRHLKKKKKKCDQRSKARRTNEKKERRKIQNKTYYIRRKWNISLALMLSRSSTFS